MILFVIFLLGLPAFLIWLKKRSSLVRFLSPVILCYGIGLLMANLSFIEIPKELATTLSEISVPLAIPLLLISTNVREWLGSARDALVSFFFCVLSVLIFSTVGAYVFEDVLEESSKIAGMTVGVYTGGTPNMSAVGLSLGLSEEKFILMNASDLICGAVYLLFLMLLAQRTLGIILPVKNLDSEANPIEKHHGDYQQLTPVHKLRNLVIFMLLAALILGVAVGVAVLITGKMNAIIIILTVTTFGVSGSFIPKLKKLPGSYELGDYLLLVFCLSLGSLADMRALISSASEMLSFTAFVMFGAIFLHFLLAAIFRLDRDTVIITSVAGIYGPAFIGPMVKVLNNRRVLLTGMTTGLLGYAIGNYLGIGLALLLEEMK